MQGKLRPLSDAIVDLNRPLELKLTHQVPLLNHLRGVDALGTEQRLAVLGGHAVRPEGLIDVWVWGKFAGGGTVARVGEREVNGEWR